MGSSSRRDDRYEAMAEEERSDRDEGSTELEEEGSADGDGFVVRCLRALDMQVMGACRADERLTPLLKLNASAGIGRGPAEDRLIVQLIQHFEVSEIGLLARCLCAPLVSIRVGKINKQGNLLCPAAARGHLNLNILPSSSFRMSYVGDDGHSLPLPLITSRLSDNDVIIRDIPTDASGRSFLLRLPDSLEFYYWLSEKSLLRGIQLLDKMKDILTRKPTLSDLTGISNSRLDSFGTHLQAYLLRSSNFGESKSGLSSQSEPSSSLIPRPTSRFRHSTAKNPNLRSRSNVSFKDGGSPRSSSSSTFKAGTREKSRRRNEFNLGPLAIPSLPINVVPVSSPLPLPTIPMSQSQGDSSSDPFALPPDILPQFSPFNPLTFKFPLPPPDILSNKEKPVFKPYYCWCPIGPSPVPSRPLQSIPLPPLSSLMSAAAAPPFSPAPPPLTSPVPLPVSSLVIPPIPIGPQFPAFSGLMSDPIVHIPIMDIRLSGQAYLVSAGPMISAAVPPLLVPATESLMEKNARETLRHLLESAPSNLTPDPVHGGVTFGIDSVMSGISSIELCSSLEGEDSDSRGEISDQEDNQREEEEEEESVDGSGVARTELI